MNHKFKIDYNNSRIVTLALLIIIQLNLIGFCLGFIIGYYKHKSMIENEYFLIKKLSLTLYNHE